MELESIISIGTYRLNITIDISTNCRTPSAIRTATPSSKWLKNKAPLAHCLRTALFRGQRLFIEARSHPPGNVIAPVRKVMPLVQFPYQVEWLTAADDQSSIMQSQEPTTPKQLVPTQVLLVSI